ncbi:unnamed protein product [Sphenostylis stenocarpa]|uniref:Uncharacterized protein n=1 Tax=Sphenostylis stenocarpa TaxID=92480 RepID=A0AA86T551_9FABA|nr:unnamed protein product [Sphenostylis stenocarpa]
MGGQMKTENESRKRNPNNTDGVVITVYKESVRSRSRRRVSDDKTKPRGIGHDRRALLLTHSLELRNACSQKVPLPRTKTKVIDCLSAFCIRVVRDAKTVSCFSSSISQSKINNALKKLSCKEM